MSSPGIGVEEKYQAADIDVMETGTEPQVLTLVEAAAAEEGTAVDEPQGTSKDALTDVLTEILNDTLTDGPNPVPSTPVVQELICLECSEPVVTETISSPLHFLCGECGASYHSTCVLGEPRVGDAVLVCNSCLEAQRVAALAIAQEKFAILAARRSHLKDKEAKAEGRIPARRSRGGPIKSYQDTDVFSAPSSGKKKLGRPPKEERVGLATGAGEGAGAGSKGLGGRFRGKASRTWKKYGSVNKNGDHENGVGGWEGGEEEAGNGEIVISHKRKRGGGRRGRRSEGVGEGGGLGGRAVERMSWRVRDKPARFNPEGGSSGESAMEKMKADLEAGGEGLDMGLVNKDGFGKVGGSQLQSQALVVANPATALAVRRMPGDGNRRPNTPWTEAETDVVLRGVRKFKNTSLRWKQILEMGLAEGALHTRRTYVDIKDKWRNLMKKGFSDD